MSADLLPTIVLINLDAETDSIIDRCDFNKKRLLRFNSLDEMIAIWDSRHFNIAAIISKTEILNINCINKEKLKNKKIPAIPVFLLINSFNENLRHVAIIEGVTDVFKFPLKSEDIEIRINFILNNWSYLQENFKSDANASYKTPLGKRIFDILFSGVALFCLSPLFLLVFILIKIESAGPSFYYSFRVGTGYRVFKFYKFRSMYINADQRLKDLKHLNQYAGPDLPMGPNPVNENYLCSDCLVHNKCQFPLYADNNTIMCEKNYVTTIKSKNGSAFIKIKDDPRVTKFGNFIRNSSIDELPQLWNVFIGNMSLVGNRPLPVYEAEKLTMDKYALRFNAPAGITGLWQVEKRGKGNMSEEERLLLDNAYALNHSFKNDILVLLKTIPALLQKENV